MQENRGTYHHGDLRRALLEVGMELARRGGPDAVTMREATRAVGVTVNAAYRHFDGLEGFLGELAMLAQAKLAERIDAEAKQAEGRDLLGVVGRSYIAFAVDEPGWFDTAFRVPVDLEQAAAAQAAGPGGRSPYVLLGDALDEMVAAGELEPQRRPGAEVCCWSAVHGFATLVLHGPFRFLERAQIDALAGQVVAAAIAGVCAVNS